MIDWSIVVIVEPEELDEYVEQAGHTWVLEVASFVQSRDYVPYYVLDVMLED